MTVHLRAIKGERKKNHLEMVTIGETVLDERGFLIRNIAHRRSTLFFSF